MKILFLSKAILKWLIVDYIYNYGRKKKLQKGWRKEKNF
jgi:hypothetical protein